MNKLKGLGVALVTPMNEDGSIDFVGLKNLLLHTQKGVDYWVVMGTTGENATLSKSEKRSILDFVLVNNPKKLPIVWGWGGNNTKQLIEEIKTFDCSGITAFLSVSPYYNKPSQEGIYQHYMAIAAIAPRPIIIYNVPGRTASNIEATTIVRLAKSSHKFIAVKEASGDLMQCMKIARDKPTHFQLLSGDDALTLPMISFGAKGVISVMANALPNEFSTMIRTALSGDFENATHQHLDLLAINDLLYEEGNPAGIKAAMEIQGICSREVRLPLVKLSKKNCDKLKQAMKTLKSHLVTV